MESTSYMTGELPNMGKSPSGSKPLKIRGLGTELEIVSLSATSTETISLGAESLCLSPSHSCSGKISKDLGYNASVTEVFCAIIQKH